MLTEKDIRIDGKQKSGAKRQYGVYHPGEGHWSYIQHVENNAPPMSKRLWKIREQLSIAQKKVFDAIIELPEDHQWLQIDECVCPSVVKDHFYSIMLTIKSMDELDYIREAA